MVTPSNNSLLFEIRDCVLAVLTAQQARRKRCNLDGWITAERNAMLATTNEWCVRLGKPPVTEKQIRKVEQIAFGHDYTRKCALHCAELVMEQK